MYVTDDRKDLFKTTMYFILYFKFTDEAKFKRDLIMNIHNEHRCAKVTSYTMIESRHYQTFRCNFWAGIIDDDLQGPKILPDTLSGSSYRRFLEKGVSE